MMKRWHEWWKRQARLVEGDLEAVVQVLDLEPDDLVVIIPKRRLTDEAAARLKFEWERLSKGTTAVVIEECRVAVLKRRG